MLILELFSNQIENLAFFLCSKKIKSLCPKHNSLVQMVGTMSQFIKENNNPVKIGFGMDKMSYK